VTCGNNHAIAGAVDGDGVLRLGAPPHASLRRLSQRGDQLREKIRPRPAVADGGRFAFRRCYWDKGGVHGFAFPVPKWDGVRSILRRYFSDKLAGGFDLRRTIGRDEVIVSDSGLFNSGFFPRPDTDELSRHRLEEILEKTLDEAMRFRSSCGFLLVAIDNLARINKSYGLEIGDEVIGTVGQRIRGLMRSKDTLGRYLDVWTTRSAWC